MPATEVDCYRNVVGQAAARAFLAGQAADPVQAYLLVGPDGAGKLDLALAFAADVLCTRAPADQHQRISDLVLAERYADVVVMGAEGTRVRRSEAGVLFAEAHRRPVEGDTKVIIGMGFDSVTPEAAALLLKAVEEPGLSVMFVLLANSVPPDLVTIASRCVRVDVPALGDDEIRQALLADAGMVAVPTPQIEQAVAAAAGNLRRARVLATDERAGVRLGAWTAVPSQLDGTGATVYRLVAELISMIDEGQSSLDAVLAAESAAASEVAEEYGHRRESKTDETARHNRVKRSFRNSELATGFAAMARRYRDAAVAGQIPAAAAADAVGRINQLMEEFVTRNLNERLQLQALFQHLPPLPPAR